jgi:hypothetical protein
MVCTIHKFSQGLNLLTNDDGTWSSDGFSGTWEQKTADIPSHITEVIKADKFKGRSVSSSNPAITARVIQGNNYLFWSVVAVIARGTDLSRPFSTHRYFWCEGKNNLCLIVSWLLEQESIPIFNPFEINIEAVILNEDTVQKYRKEVDRLDNWINTDERLKPLFTKNIPKVFEPNQYGEYNKLLTIDRLATKIASHKNRLTSWAFQVENLHKPEEFLIIQTATPQSYQILESRPKSPENFVESPLEPKLKSVILDLKDSNVTHEVLKTLESVLSELKATENSKELLEQIFDDLGANEALSEPMYKAGRMELVTLRAILIPETLLEYLHYAHIEEKTPTNKLQKILNSSNPIKQQSLDFQSKLYHEIKFLEKELPNIIAKLRDGLITIIEEFYQGKVSKTTWFFLAISKDSLWNLGSFELVQSVASDLNNIFHSLNNIRILKRQDKLKIKLQELNLNIWENLINDYWLNNSGITYDTCRAYQHLGDLFFQLRYQRLAYYFYTVSGSNVNQKILDAVQEHQMKNNIDHVFGISIPIQRSTVYDVSPQRDNTQHQRLKITNNSSKKLNNILPIPNFQLQNFFIFLFSSLATILGTVILRDFLHQVIFIGLTMLLIGFYVSSERNKSFIHQYSLPLIICAVILGQLMNNIKIVKIGNPFGRITPTPSPSASTSTNSQVAANLTGQELQKAVTSFSQEQKTYSAIKQIWRNLKLDPNITNQFQNKNEQEQGQRFILALGIVLKLEPNNYYQEIQDMVNNPQNDPQDLNQKIEPLIQAIYQFQNKNQRNIFYYKEEQNKKIKVNPKPDGIINLVNVDKFPNSTMAILQEEIKKEIISGISGGTK